MVLGVNAPAFPFSEFLQGSTQSNPKYVAGQALSRLNIPELIQKVRLLQAAKQFSGTDPTKQFISEIMAFNPESAGQFASYLENSGTTPVYNVTPEGVMNELGKVPSRSKVIQQQPSTFPVFQMENRGLKQAGTVPRGSRVLPAEKGITEPTLAASSAASALSMIDPVYEKYAQLNPAEKRIAAVKGGPLSFVSKATFPELKALEDNLIAQTVFQMGGKQLTLAEKEIVSNAFLPTFFDTPKSIELKKSAAKEYLSGRIDILEAANLLGPAGLGIKRLAQKAMQSSTKKGLNSNERSELEQLERELNGR